MSNSITTKRNTLPKSVTSIAIIAVVIGIIFLIAVSILNKDTATIVDFDKFFGDPVQIVISKNTLHLVLQILEGFAIALGALLSIVYFIIIITKKNHANRKNNNGNQERKNDESRVFIINTEDQNNTRKDF